MTKKQILKSIKTLARDECVNYRQGICLKTDMPCRLFNPEYSFHRDESIGCDYFLTDILPVGWNMNDLVSYAMWYTRTAD